MAAHDFNRPCDCRDCREDHRSHACPACGFETVVVVEMTAVGIQDHKGGSYYDLHEPDDPRRPLDCFACGARIGDVLHHRVDEEACRRKQQRLAAVAAGNVCATCGKVEGHDAVFGGLVVLRRHRGSRLCQDCRAKAVEAETPDPSDSETKYAFDTNRLKYVLQRVRRTCIDCGKSSWINLENQWKRRCTACFKAATSS